MSIRDPKNSAPQGVRPPQDIEELKRRYTALHTRRIQAETNLKHANDQLETLKRQAALLGVREAEMRSHAMLLGSRLASWILRTRAEFAARNSDVEAAE